MHTRDLFDLSGRVAIVTGGAAGIGRQMADALADMGATLVLAARKRERLEQAAEDLNRRGITALPIRCDVANPDDVQNLVADTLGHFGRIDILVNNAGITWGAPAEEMSLADWEKVIRTNVTGTFLCSQAVGRVMIQQQRGKIINVASVAGLFGSPPEIVDAVGYHASKGAIISFTRDLACKWARYHVYVNALAPGWFPSRMSRWILEHRGERILSHIPLGRFGGEDDLKGAIAFLASDASNYVTGQVLVVDGGLSIW
jgi:NAD(P)-dependent dehydrogenase (short-subunit alcohol dehydrogenase family)